MQSWGTKCYIQHNNAPTVSNNTQQEYNCVTYYFVCCKNVAYHRGQLAVYGFLTLNVQNCITINHTGILLPKIQLKSQNWRTIIAFNGIWTGMTDCNLEPMGDCLKVKNAKNDKLQPEKPKRAKKLFRHQLGIGRNTLQWPRHCYEAPRWLSARGPSCSTWSVESTAACRWTGSFHLEPYRTRSEHCIRCWRSRRSLLEWCGEDASVCTCRTCTPIKQYITGQ